MPKQEYQSTKTKRDLHAELPRVQFWTPFGLKAFTLFISNTNLRNGMTMETILLLIQEHFDSRSIIALLALLAVIQQSYASRKHNKLSVLPYLCDHLDRRQHDRYICFKVINKGLGTAKISSFTYLWDEKKISSINLEEKIRSVAGKGIRLSISTMGVGHAISKDEEVRMVSIQIPPKGHDQDDSENRYNAVQKVILKSCRLSICYESLYQQKSQYVTKLTAFEPEKS